MSEPTYRVIDTGEPLTRLELDEAMPPCGGCGHTGAPTEDHPASIVPACHPDALMRVAYYDGALHFGCGRCGTIQPLVVRVHPGEH